LSAKTAFVLTIKSDPYAAWRTRYFNSTQLADTSVAGDDADPDHDGATNRQEFLAGTDPLDGESVFKASIRIAPVVFWSSVPNRTYRIFRSPSLTSATWVLLSPLVTATNTVATFVDLDATKQSFYRVEVAP
jgi:hypothetical protein